MTKSVTEIDVLLYIPNIIGYTRILFLLLSLPMMATDPFTAMGFYLTSALLDAFDGMAARYFNQTSSLGALLDMLTDRVGTCALAMAVMAMEEYREYAWAFQVFVILDIFAHWGHMHSIYTSNGSTDVSHKQIDLNDNVILHFYYQKVPLFIFCAANELFFILLFLLPKMQTFQYLELIEHFCWLICFPLMVCKQVFSVVHLAAAMWNTAAVDASKVAESSANAPEVSEVLLLPESVSSPKPKRKQKAASSPKSKSPARTTKKATKKSSSGGKGSAKGKPEKRSSKRKKA